MDELLHSLHDEGTLDSGGHFTVAVNALEKLRRYQFTSPYHYVLPLVASAVSSGASELTLTGQGYRVQILHNGAPPSRAELETMFDSVLSDRVSAVRELGLAVNGALALPGARLRLETWDGQRSLVMRLHADGEQLASECLSANHCPWGTAPGLRLTVDTEAGMSLVQGVTGGITELYRPVLAGFCRHAPLTIKVDSKRVTQALQWSDALGWIELRHPEVPLSLELPAGVAGSKLASSARFSALLAVRGDTSYGLRWWRQGVCVQRGEADPLGLGFVGEVHCPDLKLDLTQSKVVTDELYQGILAELQAQTQRMREDAHNPETAMSDRVRQILTGNSDLGTPLLRWRWRSQAAAERPPDSARRIRQNLLAEVGPQLLEAWRQARLDPVELGEFVGLTENWEHVDSACAEPLTLLSALLLRSDVAWNLLPRICAQPLRPGRFMAILAGLTRDHREAPAWLPPDEPLLRGVYALIAHDAEAAHAAFAALEGVSAREGQLLAATLLRRRDRERLALRRQVVEHRRATAGPTLVAYQCLADDMGLRTFELGFASLPRLVAQEFQFYRMSLRPEARLFVELYAHGNAPKKLWKLLWTATHTLKPDSPWLDLMEFEAAVRLAEKDDFPSVARLMLRGMARRYLMP